MYNSLTNIRLKPNGFVEKFECDGCGFTTPGYTGLWGKDVADMEAEHIDHLHKRLNSE